MAEGPAVALEGMKELESELSDYFFYHSTRGELLRRLARFSEATIAFQRALLLAGNDSARRFILKRLAQCKEA